MRLDKYLSECTALSRKEIKKLIKQGGVFVNSAVAQKAEQQVLESDEISVLGECVEYKKYIYLMLNKPQGYLSAVWDREKPVVVDLVPEEYRHFDVSPVGRLDIDTEGLLILTNDGDLNHRLTSPKKNVYKTYFARLDVPAEQSDIEEFSKGMEFSDFTAKPAELIITENKNEVYIKIAEGKFHQVKRMCAKVGKNVLYLKRVSIGSLLLDETLKTGDLRVLTEEELELLFTN